MLFQISSARERQLRSENRQPWTRQAQHSRAVDFLSGLCGPGIKIIAEVKPASPSGGRLRAWEEVPRLVRAYEAGGACALSVLAEPLYFQGGGELVSLVRSLTDLPILWKDFVISPSQIFEAKARGAAGILLIGRLLSKRQLAAFIRLANKVGLLPLVEVHSAGELKKLSQCRDRFALGINNRNLGTMEVDLAITCSLLPQAQALKPVLLVSESGIGSSHQVEELARAGIDAFLIGEALLRAPDPQAKLEKLRRERDVD